MFKLKFERVLEFRKNGGQVASSLINTPYSFRYVHEPKESMLILNKVASENRTYLPVDIIFGNVIALQTVQVIYDPDLYLMGILSSKIHMLWVKAVAGGMKTDIVYSNSLCYNAFPFASILETQKKEIEKNVYRILEERERFSDKTLAQLYDPNKMPNGLREAHHQLDLAVEQCYRSKPFDSDEERLEYLFKLYEQMIAEENTKGTLFEIEPKQKKKTKKK